MHEKSGFDADYCPASAVAKFAPLEHNYPNTKTAPMADAVSGVPVISPKAEPSSEVIARQEQIPSEAAQPGNKRAQSSVQRAINRQNNMLSHKHYEPRDNNIFKGEPSGFAGNAPGTGHASYFGAPLVTVNRKFALSSGNRFEGLGIGRKIADLTAGTLSQQGFAADFVPASAMTKIAPREHYYPDSKTVPMVDAVPGVPWTRSLNSKTVLSNRATGPLTFTGFSGFGVTSFGAFWARETEYRPNSTKADKKIIFFIFLCF